MGRFGKTVTIHRTVRSNSTAILSFEFEAEHIRIEVHAGVDILNVKDQVIFGRHRDSYFLSLKTGSNARVVCSVTLSTG